MLVETIASASTLIPAPEESTAGHGPRSNVESPGSSFAGTDVVMFRDFPEQKAAA